MLLLVWLWSYSDLSEKQAREDDWPDHDMAAAAASETDSQRSARADSMYRNIKIIKQKFNIRSAEREAKGKECKCSLQNSELKTNKLVVERGCPTLLPWASLSRWRWGLLPWRSRSSVMRIEIYYDSYQRSTS